MAKTNNDIANHHDFPGYFYSREHGNMPVVSGNVVLAIARDHAAAFTIEFVLENGSTAEWQYRSKDDRNYDICGISSRLNATKN